MGTVRGAIRAPRRSTDGLAREVEVGAAAVHLVDEAEPRDPVVVGLVPDRLGLSLDPVNPVEHDDGTVEHAEANARPRP